MLKKNEVKELWCRHWTSEEWYALSRFEHLQIRFHRVWLGLPQMLKRDWWITLRHSIEQFGLKQLDFTLAYQFGWIVILDDYLCV